MIALMGLCNPANAAALGAATVRSALGQPLRAEIELPEISSTEAATFQAKLSPASVFETKGISFSPALVGTQISLQQRPNGQRYLRVSGSKPVNEPFVNIVIQADWEGGSITRDYTLLLDPVAPTASEAAAAAPAITPAPAPAPAPNKPQVAETTTVAELPMGTPTGQPGVAEQVEPQKKAVTAPAANTASPEQPAATTAPSARSNRITVRRGDTLSQIAVRNGIRGVSLDQMMIAILKANPDAFIQGNVNLVKAGAVIRMPTTEEAAASTRTQASQLVQAQTRDFEAYRRGLAQNVRIQQDTASQTSVQGSVQKAEVQEASSPAPAADKLTISKADESESETIESATAESRQTQAQEERVAELEQNIAELNKQIAEIEDLQKETPVDPAKDTSSEDGETASALPAIELPAGSESQEPAAADTETDAASEDSPTEVQTPEAEQAPAQDNEADLEDAVAQSETSDEDAASTPVVDELDIIEEENTTGDEEAVAEEEFEVLPASVQNEASSPASSGNFFGDLAQNPKNIALGGGLLALLLAYGLYRKRRKDGTAADPDPNQGDGPNDPDSHPDSFFDPDSKAGSAPQSKGTHSQESWVSYSPSQLDAVSDVDPIAEADVYIAYGRYDDAEEILQEALRASPARMALHKRLADIYAKRKDTARLNEIAQKALKVSGGSGVDWLSIAQLGRALDPSNPTYASSDSSPAAASLPEIEDRSASGPHTQPQALDAEALEDISETAAMPVDLNLELGSGTELQKLKGSEAGSGAASAHQAIDSGHPAIDEDTADGAIGDPMGSVEFDPPSVLPGSASRAENQESAENLDSLGTIDFDINDLALDIEPEPRKAKQDTWSETPDDPLSTKLALASEFQKIGDTDGARSLAREVAEKATGELQEKARALLDKL